MSSQSEQYYSPESVWVSEKESNLYAYSSSSGYYQRAFEEDEFALGLFLDLKKSFDTVKINILLGKLQKYGIRHKGGIPRQISPPPDTLISQIFMKIGPWGTFRL